MSWIELLSPAIVIAVVVLLWRHTDTRISATSAMLTARIDDLARTVTGLAHTVTDIDRRLATLEGRIAGWQDREHAGRRSE